MDPILQQQTADDDESQQNVAAQQALADQQQNLPEFQEDQTVSLVGGEVVEGEGAQDDVLQPRQPQRSEGPTPEDQEVDSASRDSSSGGVDNASAGANSFLAALQAQTAMIQASLQASQLQASQLQASQLQASLESLNESLTNEFHKHIDKAKAEQAARAIKQVESYESARIERERAAEAQRVAAIEHARLLEVEETKNAQQAEELRVQKKQNSGRQLRASFEHAREERESAEWQRQQFAKSAQYSHVFRQQRWLNLCDATATTDADEATGSLQDALIEEQQQRTVSDITDLVLVYSCSLPENSCGSIFFFDNNPMLADASKAAPPSVIDETEEDALITSDYAFFTSMLQLITDPSSDISDNFSQRVLEFQCIEFFECISQSLSTFSFFVDHEQEPIDVVQCRPAVAMVKVLYSDKAFAVVSSSTVWDPGGFPSRCRSTSSDVERANDQEESETPALSCLPRQRVFAYSGRGADWRADFREAREVRHTVSYILSGYRCANISCSE